MGLGCDAVTFLLSPLALTSQNTPTPPAPAPLDTTEHPPPTHTSPPVYDFFSVSPHVLAGIYRPFVRSAPFHLKVGDARCGTVARAHPSTHRLGGSFLVLLRSAADIAFVARNSELGKRTLLFAQHLHQGKSFPHHHQVSEVQLGAGRTAPFLSMKHVGTSVLSPCLEGAHLI